MTQRLIRLAASIIIAGPLAASFVGGNPGIASAFPVGPNLTTSTLTSSPTGTVRPDDSITYTATIKNTGNASATNVQFTDTADTNTSLVADSLESSPIAQNDSYTSLGNVGISVPTADGVLANDQDPDGDSISVTGHSYSGSGSLTLNSDGSFDYTPSAGFVGTDSFDYTIGDGNGNSDSATASITVSSNVWFVDNSLASTCPTDTGGNGTLNSPFHCLQTLSAINSGSAPNPQPGDTIFLYRQTSTHYSGGITLRASQKLIGQGATASIASIAGITLPPHSNALPSTGGTNPVIDNSTNGVTLSTANVVRGLDLNNFGGTALLGTSVTTFTTADISVSNSAGTAVSLANGSLNATFHNISAGSASPAISSPGISLSGTSGTFTVSGDGTNDASGGTIQNIGGTSTNGVTLDNASGVSLTSMKFLNIGQFGVGISAENSSTSSVTVNDDQFDNVRSSAFNSTANNNAAITDTVTNSTFTSSNTGSIPTYNDNIALTGGSKSVTTYSIKNNTLTHIGLSAIIANLGSGSSTERMEGTISGNVIGTAGTALSGSVEGEGIWVDGNGDTGLSGGASITLIQNNTINAAHDNGILVSNGDGAPSMDATIKNNDVDISADNQTFGSLYLFDGKTGTDSDNMCTDVQSNTATVAAGGFSIALAQGLSGDNDTFRVVGIPSSASDSDVQTYLENHNSVTSGSTIAAGNFHQPVSNASSCVQPPDSTLTPAKPVANSVHRLPVLTGGTVLRSLLRVLSDPVEARGSAGREASATAASPRRISRDASITTGVAFSVGTLPAGHNVTLTFQATVNAHIDSPVGATTIANNATATDNEGGSQPLEVTNALDLLDSTTQVDSSTGGVSVSGQSVTFTATVTSTSTGTPTGSVEFWDGVVGTGTDLGAGTPGAGDTWTLNTSALSVDGHTINAQYSGDDRFDPSSGGVDQSVGKADTSTSINSVSPEPSDLGAAATVSYTVGVNSPGSGSPTDTGAVTVSDADSSATCTGDISGGTGSCDITLQSAGTHHLTATYAGDSTFNGSTSSPAVTHGVNADTPTVTVTSSTSGSSTAGQANSFTASVNPSSLSITTQPSGTVDFFADDGHGRSLTLCTGVSLSLGQASCDGTSLPADPNPYTITANYSGDGNFNVATGTMDQTVAFVPDTLTYTGPSTLLEGGGVATVSASLTDTSNVPLIGETVTFTLGPGQASPDTCSAATDGSGNVSCNINPVTVPTGTRVLVVSFASDGTHASNTIRPTVMVSHQTDSLAYTGPSTVAEGADVSVSASLTDSDTNPISGESVLFTLGPGQPTPQTCTGVTDGNGTATCHLNPLNIPVGSRTLVVSFAGDSTYGGNASNTTLNIVRQADSLAYTGPASMTVAGDVTVSATLLDGDSNGINGKSVQFTLAPGQPSPQTCTGVTGSDGTVSCHLNPLSVPRGQRVIIATFSGDGTYTASQTQSSVLVAEPDSLTYTGPTALTEGTDVTVSASLKDGGDAALAGRTISFTLGPGGAAPQTCTGITGADGTANCHMDPLIVPTGSRVLVVQYSGQGYYVPKKVTSTVTVVHQQVSLAYTGPTTTNQGSDFGVSATLTDSSNNGVNGETVLFTLGTGQSHPQTCSSTTDSNGNVTCHINPVTVPKGTRVMVVSFSGDATYAGKSTSTSITIHQPSS